MQLLKYDEIGECLYRETIENGLSVYVMPKKGYYKSFACFAVNYGGADVQFIRAGELMKTPAGIAHFLEHKMFDTPDGGNALTALTANGASPNAMTGTGLTAYHFNCVDKFEENLKILLSFVSVPYFTEESVQKEQGIIGQEIRMIEDQPGYRCYIELMRCLFEENPVKTGVAGTVESIAQISAETLYACHRMFYIPSNMVLCVAGDVDPECICEIAREILPKERKNAPEHYYGGEEPDTAVKSENSIAMPVSMTQFMIGAKLGLPPGGKDFQRAVLTAELCGKLIAGRSSPLYAKLYRDGYINSDFEAETDTFPAGAVLIFAGESRDARYVYDEIKCACEQFIMHGTDKAYFERVRKSFIGRMIRELNSLENMCYNQVEGYIKGYEPLSEVSILSELTEEDLRAFARENLVPERMAVSLVVPANA